MRMLTAEGSLSVKVPGVAPTPNGHDLRRVFQSISAESCPRHFNFHMHTVYSDGQLEPKVLMQQAIAINLQGFAITDHHSIQGYEQARGWLADWLETYPAQASQVPQLWTGIEMTVELLETEVHILGYAFDREHDALCPYLQGKTPVGPFYAANKAIEAIHQAGGIAVLAHPARYRRSATELIPAAVKLGIDGVETYYSYNNSNPWQPSPKQTQQVREMGDAYGLLHTCGTDTHGLDLLQRL